MYKFYLLGKIYLYFKHIAYYISPLISYFKLHIENHSDFIIGKIKPERHPIDFHNSIKLKM